MIEKIRIRNFTFTDEDLMNLEPTVLRALIHERAHHTVEVSIYPTLKGLRKPPQNYGKEVETLLKYWKKRGLPTDAPDIQWAERYLELAKKIEAGEAVELDAGIPARYSEDELATVKKLIYERRSIRMWTDEEVSDSLIDQVVKAGLAAPNACNMQAQRFLVVRDKEAMKLIKGDVPLAPVKIVICSDMRIYDFMGFPDHTPQNIYFDAAAAADHMLLMAEALGLGGVWLTHTPQMAEKLRERLGLPDYLRMDTHIAIGWPGEETIKSARMPVEDARIDS